MLVVLSIRLVLEPVKWKGGSRVVRATRGAIPQVPQSSTWVERRPGIGGSHAVVFPADEG